MKLPTTKAIEALHHKYAPTEAAYELLYTHSNVVWDIAAQLIADNAIHVDVELVKVGCLLHDIGVYPLFDNEGKITKGITHGVEGEAILKREGLPEAIWRFPSHHTGVGLTKEDVVAQSLPIPVADYLAESVEELLIMYADKFHSKNNPPTRGPYFCTFEWYKRDVARFGNDKAAKFDHMAQTFGIPDFEPLVAKYGYQVRQ